VECSCEFGIEPSGSINCLETIKCPINMVSSWWIECMRNILELYFVSGNKRYTGLLSVPDVLKGK
jgi:hypothetical protein